MCGNATASMQGGISCMRGPMWMPEQAPTLARLLAWHPQPIPLLPVFALLGLLTYLAAIARVHRRGVRWPVTRTVSWLAGCGLILAVTATGVEGYGMTLMSVHMAQHMALAMVAPILLLLGQPITLALRALPARGRFSRPRRFLVAALASGVLRLMVSGLVRWLLFLSGLYGIYFTPVFDHLMSTVWGHNLMLLHFLATGLLFFGPLLQAGRWPVNRSPGIRMLEAFASTPFHAFFGITLMLATQPVVRFFTDPPKQWQVDVMVDQHAAGGIAWATSELPTLLVIGVLFLEWVRSEHRLADRTRRSPKRADNELEAYNKWLSTLAHKDTNRPR